MNFINRRDAENAEVLNVVFVRRSGFSRELLALAYGEFAAEVAPAKHKKTLRSLRLCGSINGLILR